MALTLKRTELDHRIERAYAKAISPGELPKIWIERIEQLDDSPSVAFIAAVGSMLLAKATDDRIDVNVIKSRDGSPGAFSLRSAATALASKRRAFGYDIGSSSDVDPINHSTINRAVRWDVALGRIRQDHKPFFQLILSWLPDINRMSADQALLALAVHTSSPRGGLWRLN